jgi:hypothetical protein
MNRLMLLIVRLRRGLADHLAGPPSCVNDWSLCVTYLSFLEDCLPCQLTGKTKLNPWRAVVDTIDRTAEVVADYDQSTSDKS